MTNRESEAPLAQVPMATQARETCPKHWTWVEPALWTPRMLEALDRGVKGGVWFSLMDKVYRRDTLRRAWEKVKARRGRGGVDAVSIEQFDEQAERWLDELQEQLRQGEYRPQPVKRVWIPKPGSTQKRPLGIPTVRDRVVQTALRLVIEPIFEKEFRPQSYGFRPGRSCKDALRQVQRHLDNGQVWVVDVDIRSYFDRIPHEPLMGEVGRRIADGRVLALIEGYLKAGVLDGLKEWMPEEGTPQGAVISPLLANLYLHGLDVAVERAGYPLVRYADDLVILCATQDQAVAALALVGRELALRGLEVHPDKTRLVDMRHREASFEFLGYRFANGKRWPRPKSLLQLHEKVRGHTPRQAGHSLTTIIRRLNPLLRGWFGYFQHAHPNTFRAVDGFVRRRLRTLLRRRLKKRGNSKGRDHQRWPNRFFHEQGLFSLEQAHAHVLQSLRG